jgi:hypothetical protein
MSLSNISSSKKFCAKFSYKNVQFFFLPPIDNAMLSSSELTKIDLHTQNWHWARPKCDPALKWPKLFYRHEFGSGQYFAKICELAFLASGNLDTEAT